MTGRTHDLAAFTGLNLVFVYLPLVEMSLATAIVAFVANFIGGLAPDMDQPTAGLWKRIRGGSLLGRLIAPVLGGHRMISHSLVGVGLMGLVLAKFLAAIEEVLIVDMMIVWIAFMIGMVSHVLMDMFTKEGVPLLFPLGLRFGMPPVESLRVTTGKLVEKSLIFPGLILLNGYLIFTNYQKFLTFLEEYLVT